MSVVTLDPNFKRLKRIVNHHDEDHACGSCDDDWGNAFVNVKALRVQLWPSSIWLFIAYGEIFRPPSPLRFIKSISKLIFFKLSIRFLRWKPPYPPVVYPTQQEGLLYQDIFFNNVFCCCTTLLHNWHISKVVWDISISKKSATTRWTALWWQNPLGRRYAFSTNNSFCEILVSFKRYP